MIYAQMEDIFTEEEKRLLGSFDEDEDYTILNAEIIEKLMEKEKIDINQYNRNCQVNLNYLYVVVDWFYSWFV